MLLIKKVCVHYFFSQSLKSTTRVDTTHFRERSAALLYSILVSLSRKDCICNSVSLTIKDNFMKTETVIANEKNSHTCLSDGLYWEQTKKPLIVNSVLLHL